MQETRCSSAGSSRGLLLLGALLLLLASAGGAGAELVVLADGAHFKVTAYERLGDRMRLTLPDGGRVTLALARIARVVDDEIPLPLPPDEPEVTDPPPFPVAFDDSHPVPATPYGELIYAAARRHRLNPALVAAVVRAESAFDPRAVSRAGAEGLMQLMPATARRFGLAPGEPFDPKRNLEAGARYLRWLLDRFDGELHLALAGYNAGEGTVDRYGGVPPFRETRGYLRRIFSTLGLAVPAAAGG